MYNTIFVLYSAQLVIFSATSESVGNISLCRYPNSQLQWKLNTEEIL